MDTLKDRLESIIDRTSVADVISMLVTICHEKAKYIRAEHKDEPLARYWELQAKKIETIKPQ